MKQLTEFSQKVIAVIKKIPKGKVATYSQVAALAGKKHAARGVSWILHSCSESHGLPWQRVLNSQGKISFPVSSRHFLQQKKKLQSEGVEFEKNNQVNLAEFGWKKKPAKKKTAGKAPRLFA